MKEISYHRIAEVTETLNGVGTSADEEKLHQVLQQGVNKFSEKFPGVTLYVSNGSPDDYGDYIDECKFVMWYEVIALYDKGVVTTKAFQPSKKVEYSVGIHVNITEDDYELAFVTVNQHITAYDYSDDCCEL